MSADNGVILRQRNDGKYVLHHYFASDDVYPNKEVGGEVFDTVEAAVRKHQENERGDYPTEYGLTIDIPNAHEVGRRMPDILQGKSTMTHNSWGEKIDEI